MFLPRDHAYFLHPAAGMDDAQHRTLQRALNLSRGSKARLAEKLAVRPEDLDKYLAGAQPVPTEVFLHALDIVAGRENLT
jgi:hypothetical protein